MKHVTLKEYSSLRIGGEGDLVVVRNAKELVEAVMNAASLGRRVHILGDGTNTYFGENLSEYLFIKNEIKGISFEEKEDSVFLTISAGEKMDDIVRFSVEKNLWGLENLSLIPGSVGASPVQNIGAYGVELKDTLVSLSAYDMKYSQTVAISNEACEFGYRDSLFKKEKNRYCIISVTLKLSKKRNPVLTYKPLDSLSKENCTLSEIRTLVIATRNAKLPEYREYPNVGSFFKNPIVTNEQGSFLLSLYPGMSLISHLEGYKIPAAWLIEHVACMKGVRAGDVGTWPNQPLVLVNYGDAKAQDVEAFSALIIEKIKEKTGVILEREVNCLGCE